MIKAQSVILGSLTSGQVIRNYLDPIINSLLILAVVACTLFLIIGGYNYMTSSGRPENLFNAKKTIKNSLIGLLIILSAGFISNFINSSYRSNVNSPAASSPKLDAITPHSSSGLIQIIIKTISEVIGNVIDTVATPFLNGLNYFTKSTPLLSTNSSVFNLWLNSLAIADSLFILVIILIGFHVMSLSSLGFSELSLRQILPRLCFGFLLINSSLFLIDTIIQFSNILIEAISGNQAVYTVWDSLSNVIKYNSSYGLAAIMIMFIFLVFSVILLIYYVGRLVTIYVGAVLAPLLMLCLLIPSLRDFAVSATKRYISSIFVLFVHVVILELAGSILSGINGSGKGDQSPIMSTIVGLATLTALLKTQGVMSQLSFASIGPKTARQVGEQMAIGISYIGGQALSSVNKMAASSTAAVRRPSSSVTKNNNSSSGSVPVIRR